LTSEGEAGYPAAGASSVQGGLYTPSTHLLVCGLTLTAPTIRLFEAWLSLPASPQPIPHRSLECHLKSAPPFVHGGSTRGQPHQPALKEVDGEKRRRWRKKGERGKKER